MVSGLQILFTGFLTTLDVFFGGVVGFVNVVVVGFGVVVTGNVVLLAGFLWLSLMVGLLFGLTVVVVAL